MELSSANATNMPGTYARTCPGQFLVSLEFLTTSGAEAGEQEWEGSALDNSTRVDRTWDFLGAVGPNEHVTE